MKQKLHLLKASIVLVVALFMSAKSFSQAITLSESFDNNTFAPTGWKIKPTYAGGGAGQFWTRNNGAGAIAQPHTGTGDAAFRKAGTVNLTQSLVTPMFDLSGRNTSAANVSFWMFRDTNFITSIDTMTVWINTADSLLGAVRLGTVARNSNINLPNVQAAGNGWYQYTFAYPASFTGATNYLIFQGTADPANTRRIYLDDVNWDIYPPVCSGTPNVGTIMSTSHVICGGSGSSNLSLTSPITNATGISYIWQSSASATGPWNNVATTTTYSTGTLTSTIYYQCVVACTAGGTYTTPVDTVKVLTNQPPVAAITPNVGSACPGTAVSASASATGGTGTITYSWSPSAGLNTTVGANVNATASPSGPGGNIFVVTATDGSGCTDTAQLRITALNAPPKQNVAILNGGNDSICSGVTLILRAGPGNGGNTFSWSNGILTRNDTISPTATTLYVATVTSPNSGCSTLDSILITLLPGVAPTISLTPSATAFCVGGSPLTLTATGGTTYTWTQSNNGGLSATTGSPVNASPTLGGGPGGNAATYVVTGTTSGCSNTATVTVTLGSTPALNATIYPMFGNTPLPNDSVCEGTMVRLNAIPGGGANPWTYAWSDGSNHRIDTITAMPTTTTYVVTATSTQGCGTSTDTIHLVVNPKAHASFTTSPSGLSVTFNNTSTGASSYAWTFGDGNSSTNANPTNTYPSANTYQVVLIAFGGFCGNDTTAPQSVVVNGSIGINNLAESIKLNVFPNPTSDNATISFVMESSKAQMSVLNTLGQTLISKTVFAKNNNNFVEKLSLNGLSNGVYYVQIKNDNHVSTVRFVKN